MITIRQYCKSKHITLTELAKMTGYSQSYIFARSGKTDFNPELKFINKVYSVTKERFGEGLKPQEYLDMAKNIF